jgi:uncharacterized FlaG/YvyC family protein
MTEEEISSTGQFTSLGGTTESAVYQPASTAGQPRTGATSVAQTDAAPASAAKPAKPPSMQEINSAIAAANANLASANRVLDYRVDAATGISIASIRNLQTGVVLQQMPGADIIALARMLAAWSPGKHMLLDLIA